MATTYPDMVDIRQYLPTNFTPASTTSNIDWGDVAQSGAGLVAGLLDARQAAKAGKQAAAILAANVKNQAAQYDHRGNILDIGNKELADLSEAELAQLLELSGYTFDQNLDLGRRSAQDQRDLASMLNDKSIQLSSDQLHELLGLDARTADELIALSAKRQGDVNTERMDTLQQLLGNNHDRSTALNDIATTSFDYLLKNSREGFDEQLDSRQRAFKTQMEARSGLVTKGREVREAQQKLTDEERARQMAYQGQADALGAALAGSVGRAATEGDMTKARDFRTALLGAANTGPSSPLPVTADPTIARAYEQQFARANAEAGADNANATRLASYGDALDSGNARIADTGQRVGTLRDLAAISRSALPTELAVGNLDLAQTKRMADMTISEADRTLGEELGISQRYRGAEASAMSGWADQSSRIKGSYYDALGGVISDAGAGRLGALDTYYDDRGSIISDRAGAERDATGGYYDAKLGNLSDYGKALADGTSKFYDTSISANTTRGANIGNSLQNYYSGRNDTINNWMQSQLQASQKYEDTLTQLANYKASNTKSTGSTLGGLLKAGAAIASKFI